MITKRCYSLSSYAPVCAALRSRLGPGEEEEEEESDSASETSPSSAAAACPKSALEASPIPLITKNLPAEIPSLNLSEKLSVDIGVSLHKMKIMCLSPAL